MCSPAGIQERERERKRGLLVREELSEALGEKSGGVGNKERIGGVEDRPVERVYGSESSRVVAAAIRGGGGGGGSGRGSGVVLGESDGEQRR